MQQPSLAPNEGQLAQINRKFGMFLHFGINTFNNTEWSDGKLPIESYRPLELTQTVGEKPRMRQA